MTVSISSLIRDLSTRSGRAILSQLGLRSAALRDYLEKLYAREPGEPGALLAAPVLEAVFGWKLAEKDMKGLAKSGLLGQELVSAMDNPPHEHRGEYRFPRNRKPFQHQLECWRHLLDDVPRSVLVTSGTGSGKTECFLVPVLQDLARERANDGALTGVRALFLYPLNALINSQRDRLRAWCNGFGNDIRFCLYNGETPETVPAHDQRQAGAEQVSRQDLRERPAPVLVTNSTMLEYMLARTEDRSIIRQSRGKLRWIVLDEAHTYIGSQAAEMALLLRRVLHRFVVNPSDVRFVATSATIGGAEVSDDLRRFLTEVSGAPSERVHVVTGERFVPPLPTLDRRRVPKDIQRLPAEAQYDALCHHPTVRAIRSRLAKQAATLTALREETGLGNDQVTALLEKVSTARGHDQPLLPLRVHLFHRTQRGLWACVNSACNGHEGIGSGWDFGAVYFNRRTRCEHCDFPVFELVACHHCGQEYLSAEETFSHGTGALELNPCIEAEDIDEFQLEVDLDDTDEQEDATVGPSRAYRLICARDIEAEDIEERCLGRDNTLGAEEGGTPVRLSPIENDRTVCLRCGATDHRRRLLRELRIGAPFALSTIVPIALEHTPPMRKGAGLPSQGRRLLGFSDSRQGSARLAVRLQQEAERNRVRSILYHALAAERKVTDIGKLQKQIDQLRAIGSPELRPLLEQQEAKLAQARVASGLGTLSWEAAIDRLKNDSSLRRMHRYFGKMTYLPVDLEKFANFCLYREFFRRPKRMNSAETMGIISLRYPNLEGKEPPRGWPLRHEDWPVFLKLVLDFFVRGDASAVNVEDTYLRWMGIPVRKRYVQGPSHHEELTRHQRAWPAVRPKVRPGRMPRLLRNAAGLDDSPSSNDRINEALKNAWEALLPCLQAVGDGYLLRLDKVAMLSELPSGEICPYTGRVLDATLNGLSPYLPERGEPEKCRAFDPPRVPKAYWRDSAGREADREEILEWLNTDPKVREARELGVWSNLSDRVAGNAPYFEAAEHSAQLDGRRLRELEQRFKDGEVNVLSCSTTMEMGVDIGGLSTVIMNNTPPSSTSYLQRAGRAGRRGEGVSFALTLCPRSPHGEQVFDNPLWPFTSTISVPRVALDSARLVQRHVNSLCLGTFLDGRDVHHLKTGWFFQDDGSGSSPGRQFIEWCRSDAEEHERLNVGLTRLVQNTALAASPPASLLADAATALERSMYAWRREVDALREDADQFRDEHSETRAPAVIAIERQLRRLEEEYLLRELANRQFLPGYGFPTGVVSFIPTTIDELKRLEKAVREGREEALGRRLGYPSRQMEMAIREYAPGAEIVIDGRVYESAGVTLNWHLPPGVEDVSEVQAIRHVWRCRHCGATGDAPSPLGQCPACGDSVKTTKYLEPAGFAVDVRHSPHNNVVSPNFLPVEPPWISCPTPDWALLADPRVGRFRYTDSGHLFHGSRGLNGHGYAVCLRCGRAASETGPASDRDVPDALQDGHPRLRGGKKRNGSSRCTGTGFAIQRGLSLGGSRTTDVFELQLFELQDRGTALSLGIALRRAFCVRLGIEEQEVGICVRPSRAPDETILQSIFLYDAGTGGNGYVASLRDHAAPALGESIHILDCGKQCDAGCHGCLLTFDTQYDSANLDRHKARAFLTDERLAGLDLDEHCKLLGPDSRVLTRPLYRHLAEVAGESGIEEVQLWMGGAPDMWEADLFPLYSEILRWAIDRRLTRLFIAPETWTGLADGVRHSLAALVAAGQGRVEVHLAVAPTPDSKTGVVIAVAGGRAAVDGGGERKSARWALSKETAPPMNDAWGQFPEDAPLVYARVGGPLPEIETPAVAMDQLRPQPEGTVAMLTIRKELDGRIEGFGSRFWSAVKDCCRPLKDQLEKGDPLKEVSYSDRYIATPWALLLLREVLLDLIRSERADSGTALRVFTRDLRRARPAHGRLSIHGPWQDDDARESFFLEAFGADRGRMPWQGELKIETGSPPHFRELRLDWADGAAWTLNLDQGVRYWRCRPSVDFPFDGTPHEQMQSFDVAAQQCHAVSAGVHPTYLYVVKAKDE